MGNKERFLSLCRQVERQGMDDLISWLEKTDFFTAPASTKHHGAHPGGLLEHSLNVYDELKRLLKAYPNIRPPEESVIICSLFHDLCKVDMYKSEKRNRKNSDGVWEQYDAYTIREDFCYGGHGSKSVYLLQRYINITPDEAVAINCHMSSWEEGANKFVSNAYQQNSLAWLVHVADESATFIIENEEM